MYQFYYADSEKITKQAQYSRSIHDEYIIDAIRPAMWEEHCMECSAPECFHNCVHYLPRSDGRCMRFENGIYVQPNPLGCGGQSARIKFRKWANMMTIIFPSMLPVAQYQKMLDRNYHLGRLIRWFVKSPLPNGLKFTVIRTLEFARRKKLRSIKGMDNTPTAFLFHGFSFEEKEYRLVIEIFKEQTSVFKTSMQMIPGENLYIIDETKLSPVCWQSDNLIKIYPENDIESELEILWCDFIQGKRISKEKPAKNVKCLVWDLDNTIWDGTLIETEDPDSLTLSSDVMKTIKELDNRGIIQSIASKNDYEQAWPILQKLGISEYFLYPQIHWNAKSKSIEQIASNLNIGIDSIALIDDSVFERNQVQSVWPQVRVYKDTDIPSILEYAEFDVPITAESKTRRMMYRAEEKRNQLLNNENTDTIDFLKKCNLRMTVFVPETEDEKKRCFELVVRTNQLNMSGKKYTQQEFSDVLARNAHSNFAFSCEDDFGTYGIVGFGQYRIENDNLIFTEFAMSCRVAKKYIESALFSFLLWKEHCSTGSFEVNKTKKNILLRNTLTEIGFCIDRQDDERISFYFNDNLINKEIVQVYGR